MDALTHIFLPLTVLYVLVGERLPLPLLAGLGGAGLLADLDKYLGSPGLLHSLVTLVPVVAVLVTVEWRVRGEVFLSAVVGAVLLSHLLLDIVDGGPVPLLFPIVETGVGLTYPVRTVFGSGLLGISFEGPLVALRTVAPRGGFNTYGFINGFGVASALLFGTIALGQRRDRQGRELR